MVWDQQFILSVLELCVTEVFQTHKHRPIFKLNKLFISLSMYLFIYLFSCPLYLLINDLSSEAFSRIDYTGLKIDKI